MSANQQRTRQCFPLSLFPGNGGTTGITVETAQQKKKNLVDGKKVKRQSDRNKSKQTGIHNTGVVSECVSLLTCVSSYQQDLRRLKTNILSTRSESDKACLLINTTRCLTLSFCSTDIRISRAKLDS